jgi:hypothetical protein
MPHRNVRNAQVTGLSRISGDRRPLISLSHFVANFVSVLNAPRWCKILDETTARHRTAVPWERRSVRKRKYEQKPKPARRLRISFDEAFPDLKKLPWRRRMRLEAILLGLETVPIQEELRPPSAADLAEARKVIDEALAGERGRALPQQTKQQRLIARVEVLRAKGVKKAVEIACAELNVPGRTAYRWLRQC